MKVNKIIRLIEWGIYDVDTACYIPGMLDLVFQGMNEKIMTIEQTVDTTYSNKEILKFELILDNNYYTNLKIFHLCFPIRFKKLSNIAYNSDADIYTVNNFFAHWIREINITKYGTNKCLVPTTTPKEIYRYSDSMLKHLPKHTLKMIEKNLLHSKKPVIIPGNEDRRNHNNDNKAFRTNDNLKDCEDKFANQIDSKYVYRIPLKYLCNLRKINFPTKIDLEICCMLQTDMKQLFESKKKVNAIGAPDTQIVSVGASYLQCEQILLTKNFRQYLETIMLSSNVLRMGIQKTPYRKTYKLQAGSQEFTVDFRGCDRQFDWLEISLR